MFFKTFYKIGGTAETGLIGNLRHTAGRLPEQISRPVKADGFDEVIAGLIQESPQFSVEGGATHL